ncbi:MAG: 30S ribosomal protein S17 [Tissierellia bacterium]|jgi:small subunit ribosomal protein S17|nr:30S ribosomal protein S17 [Tissierellia bacterium]
MTMARNKRKVRSGEVISNKMDKTIVVNVIRHVSHPLYQKKVKLSKRYHAHDENNQCQIGDKVQIMETRPISRHKRWRLVDITEKAK